MSIPEIKNILHTQFTRDTKIDYKTENYAVSVWFQRWDTDKSGDFNDKEWNNYQADIEKAKTRQDNMQMVLVNKIIVSKYNKQLESLKENFKDLEEKFNNIDTSAWDKLLEFEQKHPWIERNGLAGEETAPKNAYEFDISALEVGIYDKKNDCFTGECYEKGYITGLESLSEDERNEYLQLLETSICNAKNIKEYMKESDKLNQEFDKYTALIDMAESGVLTEPLAPEDENNLYSQYVNIRSSSNPFYKEIKDIEQKMTTLRLKGKKSNEDLKQIEQYQIQLKQLYDASSQWKLTDCDERPNLNKEDSKTEFQITDLSSTISCDGNNISKNLSASASWNPNDSVHVNANLSNTIEYPTREKELSSAQNAYLEVGYNKNNFGVTSSTDFYHSSELTNYTQGINLQYKNISANVSENIMSTEAGTTNTTSTSLSYTLGKYSATGNAIFSESGNTYKMSTAANYEISTKSGANLRLSPNISTSYNDATQDWMLAPTMNLYCSIKGNNITTELQANESHTTTFGKESTTTNNNFTASSKVTIKKWSFGTQFNDSDTPDLHSNTYGLNASYNIGDIGTIRAEASHQRSRTKNTGDRNTSNMFAISFTTALAKLFGKK